MKKLFPLILLSLVFAAQAFAGGAACKVVIDGGNNNGMGEQVVGAVRQMQVTNDNVAKAIFELEEYMTPAEKEAALKLSYETCDFGTKEEAEFVKKAQALSKKINDFYIELAKRHAYAADASSDEEKK